MDYYDKWVGNILDKLARVYGIEIECMRNGNLQAYEVTAKLGKFKNSVLIPFDQVKNYPEDYMTINIEDYVIWPIFKRYKHWMYEQVQAAKLEDV